MQQLQPRDKWLKNYDTLKIGDLVLIRDNNLPPVHCRLGRITKILPGSDGIMLVAQFKIPACQLLYSLLDTVADFPSAGHISRRSSSIARNSATHSPINYSGSEACRTFISFALTIWKVQRTPSHAERTRSVIQSIPQINTEFNTTRAYPSADWLSDAAVGRDHVSDWLPRDAKRFLLAGLPDIDWLSTYRNEKAVSELLQRNRDAISCEPNDLGRTNVTRHHSDTGGDVRPIK
ncbi:hypothetical protein PR048_026999 [Dryococelus australis]|uniref:DUF5641 domain-containing protein n=1 Tax=Dryococelus australis TaxID=614101 RepID=A0ABQ9GMY1_9NEOP|nr:hypothetical protein PR048_026999 [Dryococelus australis]